MCPPHDRTQRLLNALRGADYQLTPKSLHELRFLVHLWCHMFGVTCLVSYTWCYGGIRDEEKHSTQQSIYYSCCRRS